jgi:hypothetical protein
MAKKHFLIYPVLGAVSLGLIASLTYYSVNSISKSEAQKQEVIDPAKCGIRFSSGTNRMYGSTTISGVGKSTIKTNYGNNVAFNYNALSTADDTTFQTINYDGYISNSDPINGLHSITITLKENTGSISLSYGWQDDKKVNNYVYTDIIIASTQKFTFEDEPDCIKLSYVDSPSTIESINISYTCTPSINPFIGYAGLKYKYNATAKTYTVSGRTYTKGDKEIIIPKYYNDGTNGLHPVTTISSDAMNYMYQATKIVLPNSITTIDGYAFYGCESLVDINIPTSVIKIGGGIISGCTALPQIIIPESVITIGYGLAYTGTSVIIYAEPTSKPDGWNNNWASGTGKAYFYSETDQAGYWHYVNNKPVLW